MQYLLLCDIALHLLRERYDPTEHVFPVFAIGMNASRHPDTFHCAAFRFTAAVPPEHPTVSLLAFMKSDLFFMFFSACIVTGKRIVPAARLFSLDLHDPFQSFFLLPVQSIASFAAAQLDYTCKTACFQILPTKISATSFHFFMNVFNY